MEKIDELLTRGVANIIPSKVELANVMRNGKKLNVYIGIDPTSTHIHLGHAFNLRQLQRFAALGHHVTFLIGDFTALIGDTSDKDTERPVLTTQQIHENFQTYKRQAEKILDFSKVHVRHNSEWLNKLSFEEIVKLTQHFSVGDFVGRELIRKRLIENKRVGLHEVLYPVMQGYDSYFLDTDIQLGGTDQTFNMQAGRTLQKNLRHKQSFIIANEFLMSTDGRKMSKSWGNAIWLDDKPDDAYAKVMAIHDDLILQYYLLATNMPLQEIHDIEKELKQADNPLLIKKHLARQIVLELYDSEAADTAEEQFERVVQKKEKPDEVPIKILSSMNQAISDVLIESGLAASKSEAKRLIAQGGVKVNNNKISNPNLLFHELTHDEQAIVQVGKHRAVKLQTK